MKELYLEVFSNVSENGICLVPLETVIVIFLYEYCQQPPLLITLVLSSEGTKGRPHFKIKLPKLLFEVVELGDIEMPGNMCRLPLVIVNEGTTCVSGLCSVLRQIVRIVDAKHPLLGFKQNCLYACSETSIWTKFCEFDIVESVNDLFLKSDWQDNKVNVPLSVARFEVHMGKPVKAHNIQKQKQDHAREEGVLINIHFGLPDSRLVLIEELEHSYSEGHKVSLADIILFPCFHLTFQLIGSPCLRRHLPLVLNWYDKLMADDRVKKSIKFISEIENLFGHEPFTEYSVPEVPNVSLYKSESRNSRGKNHLYTKQNVIEECFEKIDDTIKTKYKALRERAFGHDIPYDIASFLADGIQLDKHGFPKERMKRKTQQLENMVQAVLRLANKGDRIVDFCSGSGYLGLALAHCLPSCTIILLENKEESLKRAREQAVSMKLSNIFFCQGNIDYFRGNFDIGVSLHACGVATDLVIEKVLCRKASFVCCPCCYGSIQPNHMIQYPRSETYRNSPLSLRDYLTLAHSADQTHDENNQKTNQGRKCMTIIDIDRCLRAEEEGYIVSLSTMEPPSCTPKNNVLVGIPQGKI